MKLIPVKSSNVSSLGYIASKQVLHAAFTNGSLYEYHDVPENVFIECLGAPSVGSYFAKNVARKFSFFKVEDGTCRGCEFLDLVVSDQYENIRIPMCKKFKIEVPNLARLEDCDEPFFRDRVVCKKPEGV